MRGKNECWNTNNTTFCCCPPCISVWHWHCSCWWYSQLLRSSLHFICLHTIMLDTVHIWQLHASVLKHASIGSRIRNDEKQTISSNSFSIPIPAHSKHNVLGGEQKKTVSNALNNLCFFRSPLSTCFLIHGIFSLRHIFRYARFAYRGDSRHSAKFEQRIRIVRFLFLSDLKRFCFYSKMYVLQFCRHNQYPAKNKTFPTVFHIKIWMRARSLNAWDWLLIGFIIQQRHKLSHTANGI